MAKPVREFASWVRETERTGGDVLVSVRSILVAVLVALAATVAWAADPPSPGTVANRVAERVAAGDAKGLTELAGAHEPDPWLVVDLLCATERLDLAARFAEAAPEGVSEHLVAFVAGQREKPSSPALRTALGEALAIKSFKERAAALAAIEGTGDDVVSVRIRKELGDAYARGRNSVAAAPVLADAAERCRRLGWSSYEGRICGGLAWCQLRSRDLDDALQTYLRGANAYAAAGRSARQAGMLHEAGRVAHGAGNVEESDRLLAESLAISRSIDDRPGVAKTLRQQGEFLRQRGVFAEALTRLEDAAEIYEALIEGDARLGIALARCRHSLCAVRMTLAQLDVAYAEGQAALALYEKHRREDEAARVLTDLATIRRRQNRDEESVELAQRAVSLSKRPRSRASALMQLGGALLELGRTDDAIARYMEAQELAEGGDPDLAAAIGMSIADAFLRKGRLEPAYEKARAVLAQVRERKNDSLILEALLTLAEVEVERKAWAQAVEHADEASRIAVEMMAGLHGVEGAVARVRHRHVHELGLEASSHLPEGAETAWFRFAERGRAGALVEELGGRDGLREATAPATDGPLRAAREALDTAEEAVASASPAQLAAAQTALEAARGRVAWLEARRDRRAAIVAGLEPAGVVAVPAVQQSLGEGQALVLYAFAGGRVRALAVSSSETWFTDVGTEDEVRAVVDGVSIDDPAALDGAQLDALRARLLEPLRLDEHGIDLVLVSPQRFLFRVPFSALDPDLRVGLVASGTTYLLLARQRGLSGEEILGLGGPEYGDGPAGEDRGALMPLPHAAAETRAVADTVFVGAEASETTLRRELAKPVRRRAIHLACHGLLESDPMRSSLALTRTDTDDGFVTARDLLGLDLATDLVVLSACETGRGKTFSAEGLLGLTRSCQIAGAPRVLASLWKVDDEATRALMEAFYAAWKPGESGAAEALRRAQAHVRSQDRWTHPRFWAGWVLWGLPD